MQTRTLIQSLDRAIGILEIIRDADRGLRAAAVAREMGLPLKTAHNLIRSLLQHGYLVQDEEKNYWLGPECLLLADQAKGPFFQLGMIAERPVRELSRLTDSTALLATEYCGGLFCATVTYRNERTEVNGHQPWLRVIHAAAAGRVLWAVHPDEELKTILDRDFVKYTPFTLTSPDDLMEAVRECRKNGYSIACDEHVIGATSLAIPVRKADGGVLGALTISFETQEYKAGRIDLEHNLQLMYATAAKLSPANRQFF